MDPLESEDTGEILSPRFGISVSLVLSIAAVLTLLDLWEDHTEGVRWPHLLIELGIVAACLSSAWIIIRNTLRAHAAAAVNLRGLLVESQNEAVRWREQSASFLDGLGKSIERQFTAWEFSPAESDVALLLLKGFSHKEIAQVRGVSERTVRQQAGTAYQKAGLRSRSELSAFFLEDLLLPSQRTGQNLSQQANNSVNEPLPSRSVK